MKPTKFFVIMAIVSLTLTMSITPAFSLPVQASPKAHEMTTASIPENAKLIGPGEYDLGYTIHEGKLLQGTLYVFSDKGFAKPDGTPGNGNGKDKGGSGGSDNSCYSYLTKGAKWRAEEPWTLSTVDAPAGIDVKGIISDAISKWENADQNNPNVIMGGYVDPSGIVAAGTLNGKNEVAFGDFAEDGVIAVTWTWRTTSGPPSERYIAEWDQLYDIADFDWSDSGDPNSMDFDNIATHEVGHAVGMGHPDSTCTLETMYAYASNGETIKRDLHDGDITGVNKLY